MAEIARTHTHPTPMKGTNEVKEEKWAKHYSSNHQILLVGEGDFSFALSLAMFFGSASNIVASSLDTYEYLIENYKHAKTNLDKLVNFGAQPLHKVDAVRMRNHTYLRMRKFDRIVFNFPDSGFPDRESDHCTIVTNKNLVQSFMWNARALLDPKGEIHVTHKTTYPYNYWNIEELATQCGLTLLECVDFKFEDYPGYNYQKGDDDRNPGLPFSLVKCSTFKFMVSPNAKKSPPEFPFQTEVIKLLALMNPLDLVQSAPGLISVTNSLIPDLSPLPEDLETSSSSGVSTSQPPHQ